MVDAVNGDCDYGCFSILKQMTTGYYCNQAIWRDCDVDENNGGLDIPLVMIILILPHQVSSHSAGFHNADTYEVERW